MLLPVNKLIWDPTWTRWCRIPYFGHPRGCPNFMTGHTGCPGEVRPLEEIIDIERKMFIVYAEFDLASHVAKMRREHPGWTDRQCRNVYYWQAGARKRLREEIRVGTFGLTPALVVLERPEAYGVNVYATCAASGLRLERIKNLRICRHVALIGERP